MTGRRCRERDAWLVDALHLSGGGGAGSGVATGAGRVTGGGETRQCFILHEDELTIEAWLHVVRELGRRRGHRLTARRRRGIRHIEDVSRVRRSRIEQRRPVGP